MVSTAVTTHAPRKSAGEFVPLAMSASTIKMPDPIIDPITMAVELKRPRLCTSRGPVAAPSDGRMGVILGLVTCKIFT